MKAVILAAGEGRRMLPLTRTVPKPLLRIHSKTILDYIFDAFPPEIDEVVMVVGYLKQKIQQHLGARYQGRHIRYVTQEMQNGSATALMCAKELFMPNERFMIIYGDEIPTYDEMTKCLAREFSWICRPVLVPRQAGIATIASDERVKEVVERPEHPKSDISAAGIMVVNSDIFAYPLKQHLNGEYYLTALMNQFIVGHSVYAVPGRVIPGFWSPDEIIKIEENKL